MSDKFTSLKTCAGETAAFISRLRDRIARGVLLVSRRHGYVGWTADDYAKDAYRQADAMLKARKAGHERQI